MAEPTLEQMIAAAAQRQATPQTNVIDMLKRLLMGGAPTSQMPQFDANGNPLPPSTVTDLLNKRR